MGGSPDSGSSESGSLLGGVVVVPRLRTLGVCEPSRSAHSFPSAALRHSLWSCVWLMSLHSQPHAPRWVLMEGSAPWSTLGLGFWPRAPLCTQWSQDSLDLLYDQEALKVGKAPGTVLSAQEVGQRGGRPSGSCTQSRLPGSPAQPLQCIRWTNRPLSLVPHKERLACC